MGRPQFASALPREANSQLQPRQSALTTPCDGAHSLRAHARNQFDDVQSERLFFDSIRVFSGA